MSDDLKRKLANIIHNSLLHCEVRPFNGGTYSETAEQIAEIEERVNEVIDRHLPVTVEFIHRDEVPEGIDLSKLPADASETLRIVRIGDYDTCACIGTHVENTKEIGHFKITSYDYNEGKLRIRFKLTMDD